MNYELGVFGGYSRIDGYERFDGRPSPSSATITIVQLDALTNVPVVGETVTQDVTGATGIVAAVITGTDPLLVLTAVSGAFDNQHVINRPIVGYRALTNDAGIYLTNDAGDMISPP